MAELFRGGVLIAATITTGLVAGLFYAYACSVMLALRRVDDRTFITVMQLINRAILNGWFALSFVGALAFTGVAIVLYALDDGGAILWPLGGALVIYIVTIFVTRRFNISLNNELDAAGAPERIGNPAAVRRRFEDPWIRWNVVRTLLSLAAFGCLCWALLIEGHGQTLIWW
ncbi:anthrone oxygenase family protein [Salinactinospora qingdaonensis]|uniref:DUF1772 domain-containing protein n=1 Tax=Salinactinospora qingdaonensis TaxID=702744 RepID=A0ABP7EUT8_9ACTN